jgi:acyl-[acyl-carrier-protein] desaturase
MRSWSADRDFNWKALRKDHDDNLHTIIEGFYAVEQYVPDYVHQLLRVIRESYGRSHFHIRWGAEEEKHSDLWRNAVLSLGRRTPDWLEEYTQSLRTGEWTLPWEDPLRMLFYTVLQERATQVNYLNLGLAAIGQSRLPLLANAGDPVLAAACRTIAVDEAAHYHFFLEAARLFLYYFPEEAVEALVDVIRHFAMPAISIIPGYDQFASTLHASGVFSRRIHYSDVIEIALKQLGVHGLRALEDGLRRARAVPASDGAMRTTAIFDSIDHHEVERRVERLFARVRDYTADAGVDHTLDLRFFVARKDAIADGLGAD